MTKYSSDIVQAIVEGVDDLTLDAIIQEFLDTPENGFLSNTTSTLSALVDVNTNTTTSLFWDGFAWHEIPYIYPSTVDSIIDSTSSLTVEQWKELYLEEYTNQAIRTKRGIVTIDSDGNILNAKDYRILVDESFTTSITYTIDNPITVTVSNETFDGINYIDYPSGIDRPVPYDTWKYIQYEYPTEKTFLSASVSITGNTLYLPYFYGYSSNGIDWTYIYSNEVDGTPTEQTDYDYPSNYYFFVNTTIDNHETTIFPKARKAKYLRLYFTGKSATTELTNTNEYTYSYQDEVTIANITFQEVVEGKNIRDTSTPALKLEDKTVALPLGNTISESGVTIGTDWNTVAYFNYQVDIDTLLNEECRFINYGNNVLFCRIYDGTNVIDYGELPLAGSINLFNRNVQLSAYENITRYIQVKTDSISGISYSIKYQSTRHGL